VRLAVPEQYCHREMVSLERTLRWSVGPARGMRRGRVRPRLYRGHDVSGHIFRLTLCVLFPHEKCMPVWRTVGTASVVHVSAVTVASGLLGL